MTEKNSLSIEDKDLLKFKSYEDYLESFITPRDLFHLRSKSISRQIIELGYHTPGSLERETFYKRVKTIKRNIYLLQNPYALCSENIELTDMFLQELAKREEANRLGDMYTIIFMRHSGKSQSQISGYIDYSYRLKSEDWQPYFINTKKLIPRKTDLSYFDWKTGRSILNETTNFKPLISGKIGVAFQNLHDSQYVIVDTALNSESDPARVTIYSEIYGHVVLYDHNIPVEEDESDEENK